MHLFKQSHVHPSPPAPGPYGPPDGRVPLPESSSKLVSLPTEGSLVKSFSHVLPVTPAEEPFELDLKSERQGARNDVLWLASANIFLAVAEVVATVTSTEVLCTRLEDADAVFRCDAAACSLAGSTLCTVLTTVIVDWKATQPGKRLPWGHWRGYLRLWIHVNAVCLTAFALLAHATVSFAQLFAVAAAACWVAASCSLAAWAWRYGMEPPEDGELPFVAALLAAPRLSFLAAWLATGGIAYGALHFKPVASIGLSTRITIVEHFMFIGMGGLVITAVLSTLAFWLLPAGRQLLVLKDPDVGGGMESPPGIGRALLRAAALAALTHMLAGAFIAVLVYGLIMLVVMLLVRLSVKALRDSSKLAAAAATAAAGKVRPKPGSSASGIAGSRASLLSERRQKEQACSLKMALQSLFMVSFGFLKVAALAVVFLFDVAFIQQYISNDYNKQHCFEAGRRLSVQDLSAGWHRDGGFALLREGAAACEGSYGRLLVTAEASDAADCAEHVAGKSPAFSLGRGAAAGRCYALDIAPCLGPVANWTADRDFDIYELVPGPEGGLPPESIAGRRLREPPEETVPYQSPNEIREAAERGFHHIYRFVPGPEGGLPPGSIAGRRLREPPEETVPYQSPNEIGEAAERGFHQIGLPGCGRVARPAIESLMSLFRSVVDLEALLPVNTSVVCAGLRRLASACMTLGAVAVVLVVSSADILSLMAASSDIATARAASGGSLMRYILIIARVELSEQVVLLILQITVATGAKLWWEGIGVFRPACGYLVSDTTLDNQQCPAFWHAPINGVAILLLILGLGVGLATMSVAMYGALYGLSPARWAVSALLGTELRLSEFGNHRTMERNKNVFTGCVQRFILRPALCSLVSLGIWTTTASKAFCCGMRQDWYEPIPNTGEEYDQDAMTSTDLVSWKSILEATAKLVSLVWLPVPRVGLVMSKGSMYLNRNVIFAFGSDGGGSNEDPQPLIDHFAEGTSKLVHVVHWVSSALLFAILLAIEFDFFGGQHASRDARLAGIGICAGVVLLIAVVRVVLDLVEVTGVFSRGQNLVDTCKEIVEGGLIAQVLAHGESKPGADLLRGLTTSDQEKVIAACEGLMELGWVVESRLPCEQQAWLVSRKSRGSRRSCGAQRLSRALSKGVAGVTEHLVHAAMILVLHETAEDEICTHRARLAAAERATDLACEAAPTRGEELQGWAENKARQDAAEEAAFRMRRYSDAVVRAQYQPGQQTPAGPPPEPPRWLRLTFTASTEGVARVSGHWKRGSRELIEVQEARVTIVARGEVEIRWPKDKDASHLSTADVLVHSSSYQVVWPKEEVAVAGKGTRAHAVPLERVSPRKPCDTVSGSLDWWEEKLAHGKCTCCRHRRGSVHPGLDGEDAERWALCEEGVQWSREDDLDGRGGADPSGSSGMSRSLSRSRSLSGTRTSFGDDRNPSSGNVLWVRTFFPNYTVGGDGGSAEAADDPVDALEAALRNSTDSPHKPSQGLASAFTVALHQDTTSLSPEEASRRERLMAVAARMLRGGQQRNSLDREQRPTWRPSTAGSAAPRAVVESSDLEEQDGLELDGKDRALAYLDEVLTCEPANADRLSRAIDQARRSGVNPIILAKAESKFIRLIDKQRAALALVEAVENRMIRALRTAIEEAHRAGLELENFPDGAGLGVMAKAEQVLQEEESNALTAVLDAIKTGGVLKLQRAIEQAHEAEMVDPSIIQRAEEKLRAVGKKKQLISLLKTALATSDPELLGAAIEQCERQDTEGEVDLNHAKRHLESLARSSTPQPAETPTSAKALEPFSPAAPFPQRPWTPLSSIRSRFRKKTTSSSYSVGDENSPRDGEEEGRRQRAEATLRTALHAEPLQPAMLRLAAAQARTAGARGPELLQAEALLGGEHAKEGALQAVRQAASSRDIGALSAAVKRCRDLRVDHKKLLASLNQLIEEQANVARVAGDHGLGNVVLAGIERERAEIHDAIEASYGGVRVVCRVRPALTRGGEAPMCTLMAPSQQVPIPPDFTGRQSPPELPDAPAVARRDSRTVTFTAPKGADRGGRGTETFKFTRVLGPESIQGEVFNELQGLVQSAVDGYNALFMACGAKGAGKSYTMFGDGPTSSGRGVIPRVVDELFAIRDRDNWRALLEIDMQMVEISEKKKIVDLLSAGSRSFDQGGGGNRRPRISETSNAEAAMFSRRNSDTNCGDSISGVDTGGRRPFLGPSVRVVPRDACVPESMLLGPSSLCGGNVSVVVDGASARRMASKQEFRRLLEESWGRLTQERRAGHVVLLLSLTRTNRATGAASRSKLVLADLAGLGRGASPGVVASYSALENVFRALSRGERRVPFRDHALTQLCQDCLGGTAKTMLLLALSPEADDYAPSSRAASFVSCGRW